MRKADSKPSTAENAARILVVDDDRLINTLVCETLVAQGLIALAAHTASEALEIVQREHPALVFLDLVLPGANGFELLEKILQTGIATNVVMMTGRNDTQSAVDAMKKGAVDYVNKPFSIEQIQQQAERYTSLANSVHSVAPSAGDLARFHQAGFIGRSPAMLNVFAKIASIAPHFQTVLVQGETGTGKERVAHILHEMSPASQGPFIVSNAAAIVDTLFESELFGHVRGAFTGASQDKKGLFEAACGGTLFLDEIGELPMASQAKLLRVLQNREVSRVGSTKPIRIDARVVAATNRNLQEMVAEGKLRQDLYYRLSALEIRLPRLRERRQDLPLLIRHFLKEFGCRFGKAGLILSKQAQTVLERHTWPGNVRELENALEYACMMARIDVIGVDDLPLTLTQTSPQSELAGQATSIQDVQLRHVMHVLETVEGNRARAAKILGISRATLYRLLADHKGLTRETVLPGPAEGRS